MNILFICKYNRFRSKIAEAYFNKINSNKKNFAISRGIIQGQMNRNKNEVSIAKEFELKIDSRPEGIAFDDLKWANLVIVVANNVPKNLFKSKRVKNKIVQWNISDIYPNSSDETVRKVVKQIIKNVDNLVKELK